MPHVSDYATVVGSGAQLSVGDDPQPTVTKRINTSGRLGDHHAHMTVEFGNLTAAPAEVQVLNLDVDRWYTIGHLKQYPDEQDSTALPSHTQMLSFPSGLLTDGETVVKISAPRRPGGHGDEQYDDFHIENMVCMYPKLISNAAGERSEGLRERDRPIDDERGHGTTDSSRPRSSVAVSRLCDRLWGVLTSLPP
jgi:hypothetical protein